MTLFGIVFPLIFTFQSTDKVDKAIERMERKFEELAGKQLRKPEIACYVDSRNLMNSVLTFNPDNTRRIIEIQNVGDGIAEVIKFRLYVNSQDYRFRRDLFNSGFQPSDINDKPEIAEKLFKLTNMIVEEMITKPKEIEDLYGELPQRARDAIENRDNQT